MNKLKEFKPKKIGIVRALQLGDLLCAIPAIRSLKTALPNSEITLIGLSWAKQFTERFNHYFNGFLEFPGFPGLPEKEFHYENLISFLNQVNKESFDLIIQMHGNGSIINPACAMMGAKRLAGYFSPGTYNPDPQLFIPYPEKGSEIRKHLKLVKFLGAEKGSEELELPISEKEETDLGEISSRFSLEKGKYICVHPGARDIKRWWGAQKFALVADFLAEKGYTIVLTGTEPERKAVAQVESLMKIKPVNLTGKTGLGVIAALIRDAAMLFSNDTGVSHIAAAVKTPSVVIFLTSDPKRWAPLNKKLHNIILPEDTDNLKMIIQNAEQALFNPSNASPQTNNLYEPVNKRIKV